MGLPPFPSALVTTARCLRSGAGNGSANADFSPPLPDSEVVKTANSAWGITERGENRVGRHGAFFETEEANRLIKSAIKTFLCCLPSYARTMDRHVPS